jgi:hypothetical protein
LSGIQTGTHFENLDYLENAIPRTKTIDSGYLFSIKICTMRKALICPGHYLYLIYFAAALASFFLGEKFTFLEKERERERYGNVGREILCSFLNIGVVCVQYGLHRLVFYKDLFVHVN